MTALLVALGAGLGAPLRWWWSQALDGRWPIGTLLVNLAGSGLVGLLSALSLGGHTWAFAATGFCGALTTFSGFAVQAVDRGPRVGSAYVVLTVAGSLLACAAGFALGATQA